MNRIVTTIVLTSLAACSPAEDLPRTLTGSGQPVKAMAVSPDGRFIAAADDAGALRWWEPGSGESAHVLTSGVPKSDAFILALSFSPDGTLIASGFDGATLWDRATGALLRKITGHSEQVTCLAFSPDGRVLATGSTDRTVRLWETETGKSITTLKDFDAPIYVLSFSRDGDLLAAAGQKAALAIWNWRKSGLRASVDLPVPGVASLVAGDTAAPFVLCASNGTVFKIHLSPPGAVPAGSSGTGQLFALSPDGDLLASAGRSQGTTLEVRQPATGVMRHRINALNGHPERLAVFPHGTSVAAAFNDGRILIWSLKP